MEHLKPFASHPFPIHLKGDFVLAGEGSGSLLKLCFELDDPQGLVLESLVPKKFDPALLIERADGLWKTTCFEAFWALPDSSSYWELNLSPAGRGWNLYSFERYREPQPPRVSYDFQLKEIRTGQNFLECELCSPQAVSRLEVSLTAVIRTAETTLYYSTCHAGAKPDFHLRAGFNLRKSRD